MPISLLPNLRPSKSSTYRASKRVALFAAVLTATWVPSAEASLLSYYIGIDDQETFTTGTYAGLPNPNYNRLTLLFAHDYPDSPASNHYHAKAIYRYQGLPPNHTTVFNVGDYLPEGSLDPLTLSLGTGIYSGKLITQPLSDPEDPNYYSSFLEIGSTQSLAGFAPGTAESYMFSSSSGRWDSPFDAADLHLELVSITPGLNIGGLGAFHIGLNNPGDDFHLGEGSELFSFTPVFWTEASAAPGIYEATFKLVDESGTFGDSGEFRFRTEVVPEPSAALSLLIGGAVLSFRRRRRAALSPAGGVN